jgi:hypothetical protein
VKSLKNLICKGYDLATVVDSLKHDYMYFAKILENMPVQLEG